MILPLIAGDLGICRTSLRPETCHRCSQHPNTLAAHHSCCTQLGLGRTHSTHQRPAVPHCWPQDGPRAMWLWLIGHVNWPVSVKGEQYINTIGSTSLACSDGFVCVWFYACMLLHVCFQVKNLAEPTKTCKCYGITLQNTMKNTLKCADEAELHTK